jgi:hypothetical protein
MDGEGKQGKKGCKKLINPLKPVRVSGKPPAICHIMLLRNSIRAFRSFVGTRRTKKSKKSRPSGFDTPKSYTLRIMPNDQHVQKFVFVTCRRFGAGVLDFEDKAGNKSSACTRFWSF